MIPNRNRRDCLTNIGLFVLVPRFSKMPGNAKDPINNAPITKRHAETSIITVDPTLFVSLKKPPGYVAMTMTRISKNTTNAMHAVIVLPEKLVKKLDVLLEANASVSGIVNITIANKKANVVSKRVTNKEDPKYRLINPPGSMT